MTTGAVRYIDAVRTGLEEAMAADDTVLVLGEDVTVGGPFGATVGLVDRFGSDRVMNTPISEASVVGMAVGAAASGSRPVVEIMFVDFVTLAMDQIVNHAAKLRYMSGGQLAVPLTIRVQGGISGAYGAQHSQSLEAWFAHVPGLKVVCPATPSDARSLLGQAIRDDDPVVVVEHRALYWTKGELTETQKGYRAVVRRKGADVTVITYSRMVEHALEAAGTLESEGVAVEVIDLRSLAPLDLGPVLASIHKTGRAVVAHEAVVTAGFGAELVARIQETALSDLRAPILRVGSPFAPVPAGHELEMAYAPGPEAIVVAIQQLVD